MRFKEYWHLCVCVSTETRNIYIYIYIRTDKTESFQLLIESIGKNRWKIGRIIRFMCMKSSQQIFETFCFATNLKLYLKLICDTGGKNAPF